MTPRIPLSSPDITHAEIEAVTRVLRTPNLSLGPIQEDVTGALKQALEELCVDQ